MAEGARDVKGLETNGGTPVGDDEDVPRSRSCGVCIAADHNAVELGRSAKVQGKEQYPQLLEEDAGHY